MDFQIKTTLFAEKDIWNAISYYEEKKKGLGERFLNNYLKHINHIQSWPKIHPLDSELDCRRALVIGFPFVIYYIEKDEFILIIAVFNTHQNPDKLKQRV